MTMGSPVALPAGRARARPRHADGRCAARGAHPPRLRRGDAPASGGDEPPSARAPGQALAAHRRAYHPNWHASFAEIPEGPLLLVANEFFDALPVHQFVLRPRGLAASAWWPATARSWSSRWTEPGPSFALLTRAPARRPGGGDLARRPRRSPARSGGVSPPTAVPRSSSTTAAARACRAKACRRCAGISRSIRWPIPGEADLSAHVDFAGLARAAAADRRRGPWAACPRASSCSASASTPGPRA